MPEPSGERERTRWLNVRLVFAIVMLLGIAHSAAGKLLVQYNPTSHQLSSTPLPPSFVDPSITPSTLTVVGFGVFTNTNVLPVGFVNASPTINLSQYVTFTIGTKDGSVIQFDRLLYDKRSYNSHGARNASVRSNLDSFSADIATLSVNPSGDQSLSFNLSGLAPTAGPVTFRIYFYNAAGTNDWDDLVSTASNGNGLRVDGTLTATQPPPLPTPSLLSGIQSERRVALVIGNGAYQYTTTLKNPVNDAQDIASVLKELRFQVILKTDAHLEAMAEAIFRFGESLKGGGVGLFYYSGHGMQVKGENYLIPIDANLLREDDIKRKTINANDVLGKMDEAKSHFNLVFLDACRNNPFPSSVRAASRGLTNMNAPTGTLLVFATNPNNVALDGAGRNGTYTKHLLQYIKQPGLEVGIMLRNIRTAVKEETGGQQVPWENGSIEGEFYFNRIK
jgi:Caspase domain